MLSRFVSSCFNHINDKVKRAKPPAVCILFQPRQFAPLCGVAAPLLAAVAAATRLYQWCPGRGRLCLGLHISDGDCFPLFSACFRTDVISQRVAVRTAPIRSSSQLVTASGVSCVCIHLQTGAFDRGGSSHVYTQRCVGVPRFHLLSASRLPICFFFCDLGVFRSHILYKCPG